MTAVLSNVTFRNVCSAPSIGDAALCWCWFKAGAQSATSPSTRAVFAGHAPVPGGAWHVFQGSQDDKMSCQKIGLCLCAWAWHQSRRRSPLLQMFCYTPGRQSQLDVPNISLGSSSSSQSPELRADRRRTVTKRGLVPNKWLFQACPCCFAVWSFLLFAFTVVPLSLWLPCVITSTDEKTLLGTNTIINLLRFWSIWKMNSADFQRINLLLSHFYDSIQCSYLNKRRWIMDLP